MALAEMELHVIETALELMCKKMLTLGLEWIHAI